MTGTACYVAFLLSTNKNRLQTCTCCVVFVSAVDSITDVYTVNQLKQKAWETLEPFFGITYSFISKLDLDSSVSKVIKTRW